MCLRCPLVWDRGQLEHKREGRAMIKNLMMAAVIFLAGFNAHKYAGYLDPGIEYLRGYDVALDWCEKEITGVQGNGR